MNVRIFGLIVAAGTACFSCTTAAEISARNVLVIAIDDLNDWVGCLGGHPQVLTPNLDRLAQRGVLFTNAHVQATYCGPSRISVMSGRMPGSTGCYGFTPRYDQAETLQDHLPLHGVFAKAGFTTAGGGKILHEGLGQGWVRDLWSVTWGNANNPSPKERVHWPVKVWDWGAFPESDEQMGDFQLAQETATFLREKQERPFFAIAGFRRPHVPLHVPKKWFDLYPLESVQLPEAPENDLDDVPHPEISTRIHRQPDHREIVEKGLWKSLVQAYLASISFADHCVGEVLRGLDDGPNAADTVVILWSDHGFHLGEKQHWAKRTLWEETTRVPLIVAGPGLPSGQRCSRPVGLIDLYPTLCEMFHLPAPAALEGRSLMPLLAHADAPWDRPAVTTLEPHSHAVRSENWRFIRYADGSEELYDHTRDPNEWTNLARDAATLTEREKAAHWLPTKNLPDHSNSGDE
ncbi:MAG: sulfatase [Verrucomicrobiales bacterium]|nr:sulfatase [Verrucomicrobiales bacterium]